MEANKGPNAVQCHGVVSLLIRRYRNTPSPSIQTSVSPDCWGCFGRCFLPRNPGGTGSVEEVGKDWLTMLKSRRSLSSLSVPTGAILCGWFILQLQQWA